MKNYTKILLILALFALAFGGFGLHYRIHPPAKNLYGYIPFIAGLIGMIAVPVLFYFRKTIHLAYLLNGFTAIIGIITMAHFSLVRPNNLTPDIAILIGKFIVGYVIFRLEFSAMDAPLHNPGWKWIRYPNMGYWAVHLAVMSVVYYLGNLLWR